VLNGEAVAGVLEQDKAEGADHGRSTEPGYIDVSTPAAQTLNIEIPDGHTALVYVYEGEVQTAEQRFALKSGQLARLSRSGELELVTAAGSRLLVITGKPIGEPIVQRGPFVMNTAAEIQQAIRDFSEGRLVPDAEVA
jgi:redox-sensitive bicupin YhaK (pirin superfamily)